MGLIRGLAVLCLLCAASAASSADLKFNPKREGIFVLKVSPAQFRVIVFNGKVVDGGFVFSKFTPARFSAVPTNGYIVGKAKAGEMVAIESVGSRFACAGNKSAVFQVTAGQVVYAGDVQLSPTDHEQSFNAVVTQDPAAAEQFIQQNYAELAGKFLNVPASIMPVNHKCPSGGNTIYIPIHI